MIYAKKLKKKCMVRGCGNTETFALSRSGSEFGNVFICASCLAEGLSQVDEARKDFDEKEKMKSSKPLSAPAPLFYHPENHVTKTIEQSPEPPEPIENALVDEVVDEVDKSVDEASDEASTAVDEVTDDIDRDSKKKATGFICVECGREFDTLKGLNMHANVHKE
jgi:hypothetical protein